MHSCLAHEGVYATVDSNESDLSSQLDAIIACYGMTAISCLSIACGLRRVRCSAASASCDALGYARRLRLPHRRADAADTARPPGQGQLVLQLTHTFELPLSSPLAAGPAVATSAASAGCILLLMTPLFNLKPASSAASPYHTANSRHRRSIRMRDPRLGLPIATAAACVIVRTARHYRIAYITDSSPRRAAIVRLQLDIAGHRLEFS